MVDALILVAGELKRAHVMNVIHFPTGGAGAKLAEGVMEGL